MTLLRGFLDGLPTPLKVALWLAVSGAVTYVGQGVTSGQIHLDASTLALVNVGLVLARELLDKAAPATTGAK